jgi:hypothetical protein
MATSDTRPPITAGPMERALRFLKSASVSGTGEAEGVGVGEDDTGAGEDDNGSWAVKIEIVQLQNQTAQKHITRMVMRTLPSRLILVGQAHRNRRSACPTMPAVCDLLNRCNLFFTF